MEPSADSSTTSGPTKLGLFGAYLPGWQMTAAERCALLHVLRTARPEHAIEVGTADGGSLSAIASLSGQVYTLDKQEGCAERLGGRFPNVRFLTGYSHDTLPPLVAELSASGAALGFVLIDGSHERATVRADIEATLAYRPHACPLYILMHDCFNPACRAGIAEADWAANPHVRRVELDFVPGVLHQREDIARQMWGGFALAVLLPEERGERPPKIIARQELLFQTVRAASAHAGE